MAFLRSEILKSGNHYRAVLYYTSYVFWETSVEKTFDNMEDAIEWMINERCNIKILTNADKTTYSDVAKRQVNKELKERKKTTTL